MIFRCVLDVKSLQRLLGMLRRNQAPSPEAEGETQTFVRELVSRVADSSATHAFCKTSPTEQLNTYAIMTP